MTIPYLVFLLLISAVFSSFAAGVIGGRGSLSECILMKNWSVTSWIVFLLLEISMIFFIYLQATGQMVTFFQVIGRS